MLDSALGFHLAIEAAAVPRVASRSRRVNLNDQRIGIAIHQYALDLLHVSAGSAFVPAHFISR